MKLEWKEEELLEAIWTAEERREPTLAMVQRLSHVPVKDALLERMEHGGLFRRQGETIELTDTGRDKARAIIRRHRLAERLLHDVLSIKVEDAETTACEFEHVLAPGVVESICTLLGHPRECPHGSPIPEGNCCHEVRTHVGSLIIPLTELKPGETARVTYLNTAHHPRLHKLISFGVAPGSRIRVHQTYPSFIIQSENTELALEEAVARDIFVRRES